MTRRVHLTPSVIAYMRNEDAHQAARRRLHRLRATAAWAAFLTLPPLAFVGMFWAVIAR